LAIGVGSLSPADPASADSDGINAQVQDYLATQLDGLPVLGRAEVLVHGTDIATARAAVAASGLHLITTFDKIGVAAARGTADQIRLAGNQPGISYLEGNTPFRFTLDTSNKATRGAEAVATQTGANGRPLNGSGVSVAVIDSGVDPTHPFSATRTLPAPSLRTSRASAWTNRPSPPTACFGFRSSSTPTPSPVVAMAPTSVASSPGARPY